jgi:predicted kinase
MLIIFAGLPGVGKTSIARELARQIGATYLRIDTIEQAIRDCGMDAGKAGYSVAYALADENLRLGRTVVADSVNPLRITRDAWLSVAKAIPTGALEIEVLCSDRDEHRRRVETRTTDIAGLTLPAWQDVSSREYDAWDREHLIVETAATTVEANVRRIRFALHELESAKENSGPSRSR